jgi:hypothetical protein
MEHALPNGVAMFSPNQLGIDAERFQFKAAGSAHQTARPVLVVRS